MTATAEIAVLAASEDERAQWDLDAFAAAIAAAARRDVPVVVGGLADAPADAYLLAFGFGAVAFEAHPEVTGRVIQMRADGGAVRGNVERFTLAGAVDAHRYFQWRTERGEEAGVGLVGRKDLAAAIGARAVGFYETERYDLLQSARAADLPALIVAYLDALAAPDAAGGGARTVDGGRVVVGDAIAADAVSGLYRGHVAGSPRERRLIAVSGAHGETYAALRARFALAVAGVTPLVSVGAVDAPDGASWRGDALVEVEPEGVAASTLAPLGEAAAIRIAIGVAAIAARAHAAGLVLGGIRPELIYVRGTGDRVEVTAIAPRAPGFIDSGRGGEVGIPTFASLYERETLVGQDTTAASDVFALCATVFELVAGAHPFGGYGEQLGRLAAADPIAWPGSAALGELLHRGLAADPAARPTAAELRTALSAL